jgi:Uma2 family endonuclease
MQADGGAVGDWQATIDDLANAPDFGRYELVGGRLVYSPPMGGRDGHVTGRLLGRLMNYEDEQGGYALGSNLAFIVDLPHRRSFTPRAAFMFAVTTEEHDFLVGAPLFAVEVRGKDDYSPDGDAAYAAKRADYFAAGTQVVWDVNPRERRIDSYRADAPDAPRRFMLDDIADAEPALPGWRVPVADLLRS